MRKLALILSVVTIYLLSGCSGSGSAKIKVVFHGMKNKNIVVEELVPGRVLFLDSLKTNSKGKFSFRYKFKDENPVFLRLRSEDDHLTLLASPGERISVNSIINLSRNYKVQGSPGSEQVRDLNVEALDTYYKIQELYAQYTSSTVEEERNNLERQLSNLYVSQKRKSIEFLVKNNKSMACVVALYQTLPSGMEVFGEKKDFMFFEMISDSLSTVYPTSPHVKALIKSVENQTAAFQRLQSIVRMDDALPNIDLPDIYGVNHDLSSLVRNKTILLTFWSAADPRSGMLNKEMKELYKNMENRNFEIYQVSLDDDKNTWVTSVIEQDIPWVSVRDEAGGSRSIAARIYQISSIPANYLIANDGTIVGKNLWGSDLIKKVDEITK